jgi:hypothetical protein
MAYAAADEGHRNDTFFWKFLEHTFPILAYPIILFKNYAIGNSFWFVLILFNAIFYALLIEFLIMVIQNLKKKKVE